MKKFTSIMAAFAVFAACIAGMGALGALKAHAEPKSYDEYVSVASSGNLAVGPTLVLEPASRAEIEKAAAATPRPASVIVSPDRDMNVRLGGETVALADLFDDELKGNFIPVVRLGKDTVDPFLGWLKGTYAIKDIMAISSEISVIAALYADETGYLVNTVYDLTETTLQAGRYTEWEHVAEANKAGCNILMYDGKDPNLHVAAEYVEALTKVCWAYTETEAEAACAMAAGCYGVVGTSTDDLLGAAALFREKGFARAQYVAAHRGITKYANEQSLTGVMASYNEGATHAEIDIQITSDEVILVNHDNDSRGVTGQNKTFVNETAETMQGLPFSKYKQYEDTFATLDETVRMMQKTDVILIIELKSDSASVRAVEELHVIENLKKVMDRYPAFRGHWYTITFFAPYAEKMRELMPEIPVGFLGVITAGTETAQGKPAWGGGHKQMTDIAGKIAFLRSYNIGLDESKTTATNTTACNYLARGYTQNTWTFSGTDHFGYQVNVATTNNAEDCAMLVKEISAESRSVTRAAFESKTADFECISYNGWRESVTCSFIVVEESASSATVIPYLSQTAGATTFGLYGLPTHLEII